MHHRKGKITPTLILGFFTRGAFVTDSLKIVTLPYFDATHAAELNKG